MVGVIGFAAPNTFLVNAGVMQPGGSFDGMGRITLVGDVVVVKGDLITEVFFSIEQNQEFIFFSVNCFKPNFSQ